MTPKFSIGDTAWRATFDNHERWTECPDCGGTGRLRVTFHDETTASIECQNCASGYNPPTGKVRYYERTPVAERGYISGMEIEEGSVTYTLRQGEHSSWRVNEEDLFETEEEALARGVVMGAEYTAEELRRISQKEKPARTWAWNASYHRGCIKRAQRDLEYHTRKLQAANLKVREEKKS